MPRSPALGHPYQVQLVELVIRRGVGTRRAGSGGRADLAGPRSEGRERNHPLPGTCGEEGEVNKDEEVSEVWSPSLCSLLHPHPCRTASFV